MKIRVLTLAALTATFLAVGCAGEKYHVIRDFDALEIPPSGEYVIGASDALEITVANNPELTRRIVVRPDGAIAFPFLDDVTAAGLTPTELSKVLTERLSLFVKNCQVTVTVAGFNSKRVYVLGEVGKQGPIPYTGTNTIVSAIAEAGNTSEAAASNRIRLVRWENGNPRIYIVNFDEITVRGDNTTNIALRENDVIYVPKNRFAKFAALIDKALMPIRALWNNLLPIGSLALG